MARQKILRVLQATRQRDGSYVRTLPINTSDEVYTDISNKKTLRDELGEMLYKKNTVTGNGSSVTTFRDPALYIGPEGAISGDVNIKLPMGGNSEGINISTDMTISGSDHVILEPKSTRKIDSMPGTPGPTGETTVYCSDMSALGNILVAFGGLETYSAKAYKVYDNSLEAFDIYGSFNGPITRCSVSEDGTFLALMDSSHIHTYYRLSEDYYYQTGSMAVDNIADITCMKVCDPYRTIAGKNNPTSRLAFLFIGTTDKSAKAYTFSAFSSPIESYGKAPISDVALGLESNSAGTILFIRTPVATQTVVPYVFNTAQESFKRDNDRNYSIKLVDFSLSPSGAYITNIFSETYARVFKVTGAVLDTSTNIVKEIQFPNDMYGMRCRMLSDTRVAFWGRSRTDASIGIVRIYDYQSNTWIDTANINSYISGVPGNIVLSANRKYGFIIKGPNSNDATPAIFPFEQSASEVTTSIGLNELKSIPSRFIAMSNDGKYVAIVPRTSSNTSSIKIFKEENGTYMDITPVGFTYINEPDVVALVSTESGDTISLVTKNEVYVYRLGTADIYSEQSIPDSGVGTNTCADISESYNGYYILYIGKETSPYLVAYSVSEPSLGFTINTYSQNTFPSGAITTKVVGIGVHKRYSAFVATVSADASTYNISKYDIGGSTMISNKSQINIEPISGQNAKIEFSISRNGEYIVAVDKNNEHASFYCRNGSKDVVEMGFEDTTFSNICDAVFDHNGRFMYVLNTDNSIVCYSIRDGEDNVTKVVEELLRYSDSGMSGLNKLLLADTNSYSKLLVSGYVFPYFFVFDVDVISGFVDVNLSGTIITENRTNDNGEPYSTAIWKNVTLTHNNPKLISSINVGTDPNNGVGIIAIKSFDEKWIHHAVQINRLSVYGELDPDIDYTNISVTNNYSNPGTIKDAKEIHNSIGIYKDISIVGSGTINGNQIVGLTRLKNTIISKSLWINEKTTTDSGFYRYRIFDRRIDADSMVNIDIKTPADVTVANAAGLQGLTVEGDGYVDIYATSIPTTNITVDINIFR